MGKAYRVLGNADSPDWLQLRHSHITATEVGVLMGLSPFKSRDQLLEEKRASEPTTLEDNRFLLWGKLCEEINMAATADFLGTRARGTHVMLESTVCPRVSCTLDGLVKAPSSPVEPRLAWTRSSPRSGWVKRLREALEGVSGQMGVLEMKQTGERNRSKWTDGPPEHYWAQVQTQLFVTGKPWAILSGRVGTADLICHFIPSDPIFHEELVDAVTKFWEDV